MIFKSNLIYYSKIYDYAPLPTVTVFGPTLPNVTQRDINVTDRYRWLPFLGLRYRVRANVTQRDINVTSTLPTLTVTSVTDRNKGCFEQIFKVF
jgi:hypothetical protein